MPNPVSNYGGSMKKKKMSHGSHNDKGSSKHNSAPGPNTKDTNARSHNRAAASGRALKNKSAAIVGKAFVG